MTGDQTEMPLGIHGTTGIVKYLSFLSIVTPYISPYGVLRSLSMKKVFPSLSRIVGGDPVPEMICPY